MKPSNEVIIRTVVLAVTWINMLLSTRGWNPLPFSDTELGEAVSALLAFAATVWSWWKNNSATKEAIAADKYMRDLKEGRKSLSDPPEGPQRDA